VSREAFEHVIRAAAQIVDDEIVVVGARQYSPSIRMHPTRCSGHRSSTCFLATSQSVLER
jgi:hypothetical protein